jgi:hypothetical protein
MERTLLCAVRPSPAYHRSLLSSILVLYGEDGGLRYPKESIKLICELGRLLSVF